MPAPKLISTAAPKFLNFEDERLKPLNTSSVLTLTFDGVSFPTDHCIFFNDTDYDAPEITDGLPISGADQNDYKIRSGDLTGPYALTYEPYDLTPGEIAIRDKMQLGSPAKCGSIFSRRLRNEIDIIMQNVSYHPGNVSPCCGANWLKLNRLVCEIRINRHNLGQVEIIVYCEFDDGHHPYFVRPLLFYASADYCDFVAGAVHSNQIEYDGQVFALDRHTVFSESSADYAYYPYVGVASGGVVMLDNVCDAGTDETGEDETDFFAVDCTDDTTEGSGPDASEPPDGSGPDGSDPEGSGPEGSDPGTDGTEGSDPGTDGTDPPGGGSDGTTGDCSTDCRCFTRYLAVYSGGVWQIDAYEFLVQSIYCKPEPLGNWGPTGDPCVWERWVEDTGGSFVDCAGEFADVCAGKPFQEPDPPSGGGAPPGC